MEQEMRERKRGEIVGGCNWRIKDIEDKVVKGKGQNEKETKEREIQQRKRRDWIERESILDKEYTKPRREETGAIDKYNEKNHREREWKKGEEEK